MDWHEPDPEVSTALLVAIVGVTGTLAGSIVTGGLALYRTKVQQRRRDRRRRAEHYIEVEVEYLVELYNAVLRCDHIIHGLSSDYDEDMEQWREYAECRAESDIHDSLTELENTVRRASIFLDGDDAKAMSNHLFLTTALCQEMGAGEPGVNRDHSIMKRYRESRNEVKQILRSTINRPTEEIATS